MTIERLWARRSRSGGLRSAVRLLLALLLGALTGAASAVAQAPASTIDRIRETGSMRIGYGTTAPFSFTQADGSIAGYSIDLCNELAREIAGPIGVSAVRIEYVPRTPANRIQLLNDGHIDIECNASTNSQDRRKVVSFAPPHFIAQTHFVALKKSGIRTIDHLRGKTVSVVLGTVNVGQILQFSRDKKLGLAAVPVADVQAAFDLVQDGSVSAFAMDDVLLKSMVIGTGQPDDYVISDEPLGEPAPYGFMTRIDDPAFAELVATSLKRIYRGPKMMEIYDKWFMRPIRGERYSLDLPMSDELKAAMGISAR
jgi:glutamate/aspartate transport system substrate-binding protein